MKWKEHRGGSKDAWDESTRQRAMEIAEQDGAEAASAETGIPSGTIRSWQRRARVKAERDKVDLDGLEEVKRQGWLAVLRGRDRDAAPVSGEKSPLVEPPKGDEKSPPSEPPVTAQQVVRLSRSARRRRRKRERKAAELVTRADKSEPGGYAVRAPAREELEVAFGGGRRVVDDDSVQAQIGGRNPRQGGPAR